MLSGIRLLLGALSFPLHLLQAQLGWSAAALAAGAADVGLSPSSAGLLDRGEAELVEVGSHPCCGVHIVPVLQDGSW